MQDGGPVGRTDAESLRVILIALSTAGLIFVAMSAGCKRSDKFVLQPFVPPERTFSIKVPVVPEARMVGASHQYTFYSPDKKAAGPLLTIDVSDRAPEGAVGAPPEISLDKYEEGYRAESGAVVSKPILGETYSGRELDITGARNRVTGERTPLRIRIYRTSDKQYWVEWNPDVPHSTECADTFVIP